MTLMAWSLYNPHATLMVIGAKKIETRHWPVRHRGVIAIYATVSFPADERGMCREEPFRTALREAGYLNASQLPCGFIVGVVTVVDCIWINDEDDLRIPQNWEGVARGDAFFESDEYAYGKYEEKRTMTYCRDAARLARPVKARPPGQSPIWPVSPEVEAEVRRALREPLPEYKVPEGSLF